MGVPGAAAVLLLIFAVRASGAPSNPYNKEDRPSEYKSDPEYDDEYPDDPSPTDDAADDEYQKVPGTYPDADPDTGIDPDPDTYSDTDPDTYPDADPGTDPYPGRATYSDPDPVIEPSDNTDRYPYPYSYPDPDPDANMPCNYSDALHNLARDCDLKKLVQAVKDFESEAPGGKAAAEKLRSRDRKEGDPAFMSERRVARSVLMSFMEANGFPDLQELLVVFWKLVSVDCRGKPHCTELRLDSEGALVDEDDYSERAQSGVTFFRSI